MPVYDRGPCSCCRIDTPCCGGMMFPSSIHVHVMTDCPLLCPSVEYDMLYVGGGFWELPGTPIGLNNAEINCIPGSLPDFNAGGHLWWPCGGSGLTIFSSGLLVRATSCTVSPFTAAGSGIFPAFGGTAACNGFNWSIVVT